MTETDRAATSPEPESSPPRRAHTFLGRLAAAVREQNWFAVVLEVAVVVLGVVIGFQVNAWGEGRADRAREAEYLRQFRADLDRTEQIFADTEPQLRQGDRATAALLLPYRTGERPPPDSIYAWLLDASHTLSPYAVVETAEALVATGDLTLVRDDSLRAAITDYLALWTRQSAFMEQNSTNLSGMVADLNRRVDLGESVASAPPPAREHFEARMGWVFPFPEGGSASPFPLDVEAFYTDQEAYAALWRVHWLRFLLRINREDFRVGLAAIRERMERAAPL